MGAFAPPYTPPNLLSNRLWVALPYIGTTNPRCSWLEDDKHNKVHQGARDHKKFKIKQFYWLGAKFWFQGVHGLPVPSVHGIEKKWH